MEECVLFGAVIQTGLIWSRLILEARQGQETGASNPEASPFGVPRQALEWNQVDSAWSPTAKLFASDPKMLWEELTTAPDEIRSTAGDFELPPNTSLALDLADEAEAIGSHLEELSYAQSQWHELPLEAKAALLENFLQLGQGYLQLAQSPQASAEDSAYVMDQIAPLAERSFELAAQFTTDDSQEELHELAPLFRGFQYLSAGDLDAAEIELKAVSHIPEAQAMLERIGADRERMLNLAVLDCWKAFNREAQAQEWNQLQGAVAIVVGAIEYYGGAASTAHERHYEHWDHEAKLTDALSQRLQSGEARNLREALEQIKASEAGSVSGQAEYYLSPNLRHFSGELGPQLAHLVALSDNLDRESTLKELQGIAWDLHAREGFVETPLALYTLVSQLGSNEERQSRALEGRDEILAALDDEATWSYSAQKLLHNLNPKDVGEIAPLLVAGGVGGLARLGALARLEALGITGYRATALAFGAEVLAEGSTLWALNTAHGAAFNDMSQVFTAENLARSYGATVLMIGGLKGVGRMSQSLAPRLAFGLGLVTQNGAQLSRSGMVLSRGLSHSLGMGGMVGTSKVLQWMQLQDAPMGGERFSILNDIYFYWKFTLLHKVADSITLGKVTRFQGEMHREVAVRESRLMAVEWVKRMNLDPQGREGSRLKDKLAQTQLQHPHFSLNRWGRYLEKGEIHRARSYLRRHGLHDTLGPLTGSLAGEAKESNTLFDWVQGHPQYVAALGTLVMINEALPVMDLLQQSLGLGGENGEFLPLIMGTVGARNVHPPDLIEYHENHQLGIYDGGTLLMDHVPGRDPGQIFHIPLDKGNRTLRKPSELKRVEIPSLAIDINAKGLASLVEEAFRLGIDIEITGSQGWSIVHRGKDVALYHSGDLKPRFLIAEKASPPKGPELKPLPLKKYPNTFELELLKDLGYQSLQFDRVSKLEFLKDLADRGFKQVSFTDCSETQANETLKYLIEHPELKHLDVVLTNGKGKTLWQKKGSTLSGKNSFINSALQELILVKRTLSQSRMEAAQKFFKDLPYQVSPAKDLITDLAIKDIGEAVPGLKEDQIRHWLVHGQIFGSAGFRNASAKGARDMVDKHLPFAEGLGTQSNGWSKAIHHLLKWCKGNPKRQKELRIAFANMERDSQYSSHFEQNAFQLASFIRQAYRHAPSGEYGDVAGEMIFTGLQEMNRRYRANSKNLIVSGTLFDIFLSQKSGNSAEIRTLDTLIREARALAKQGHTLAIVANPTSRKLEGSTPDFSITSTKDGVERAWSLEVKKGSEKFKEWRDQGADGSTLLQEMEKGFRIGKDKDRPSFGEQLGHGLYQLSSPGSKTQKVLEVHLEREAGVHEIERLSESLQQFLKQNGSGTMVRLIYFRYQDHPQTGIPQRVRVTRLIDSKEIRDTPQLLGL